MQRPTLTEDRINLSASLLDDTEFEPLAVRENRQLETTAPTTQESVLDSFLATVKWIFLFVPGAAAIHFICMGVALFLLYEGPNLGIVIGSVGIFVVAVFMVMLGVGRFSDLRYLRVVAGLVSASALAAIIYSLSIVFIPGDFFGWFTLLTLPLAIIIGQLVKQIADHDLQPDE